MKYTDVIDFWFTELSPDDWFKGGVALDQKITKRFKTLQAAVALNECAHWRETAAGSLAEIIVLDQFTRNIFRGTKEAFACDAQALALAQVALAKGFTKDFGQSEKMFLYMPFMHSESKLIHKTAVELFTELGNEESLKFEKIHQEIIDRFGRYPHRNKQLDRQTTPAEQEYLDSESESFFSS